VGGDLPGIPGAITQGQTLDEACFMLKDAIHELHAARRDKAERKAGAEGRKVIREPLEL
jgi:predicted RNase H-like HicB family nuclease